MDINCLEQFLNDVVKVELVLASACDFDVPCQVSGLTQISGSKTVGGEQVSRIGTPALSLGLNLNGQMNGELDNTPSMKQSEKRMPSGIVVSFEFQLPIIYGFDSTRTAAKAINTKDFHVVLTTDEGSRYLCYALPNTSSLLLDEQGVNSELTVKVALQSMSHAIAIL